MREHGLQRKYEKEEVKGRDPSSSVMKKQELSHEFRLDKSAPQQSS
jgi:hypothetical protein